MSIASPQTDEERKIAHLLDQGFDNGWNEAIDAAIRVVVTQTKHQPTIDALVALKTEQ